MTDTPDPGGSGFLEAIPLFAEALTGDFSATLELKVNRIYALYYEKLQQFYGGGSAAGLVVQANESLGSELGSRFYKFAKPDPGNADDAEQSLASSYTALARNDDTLTGIRGQLDDWVGSAANNFRNYLTDTESAIGLQRDALTAVQKILANHKLFVSKSRQDVMGIADQTIAALEAATKESSTNWVEVTLGVVAAAGGIAAAPFTGGSSLAITAAVTAAMAGGAATIAGATTTTIGGGDPVAIIESTKDALTELENAVAGTKNVIAEGIKAASSGMRMKEITPPTPSVATSRGLDRFRLSPDVLGGS